MLPTKEAIPSNSPLSSDSKFVRSRLIVRRLKRMRTKTLSLAADYDDHYSSIEDIDGPQSLPYSINAVVGGNHTMMGSKCCTPLVKCTEESESDLFRSLNIEPRDLQGGLTQEEREEGVFAATSSWSAKDRKSSFTKMEELSPIQKEKCIVKKANSRPYHKKCKLPRNLKAPKTKSCNGIKTDLNRLRFELSVQEATLDQAKKALAVSSLTRSRQEERLEAEKALLLTTIKYEALKREIERVQNVHYHEEEEAHTGLAQIKEILVTVEKPATWSSYYLLCVAVEKENVKSSPLSDSLENGSSQCSISLVFKNLQPNFSIAVYLYGIALKETRVKSSSRSDLFSFATNKKPIKFSDAEHGFMLLGSSRLELSHINSSEIMFLAKSQNLGQSMKMHIKGDIFLETLYEGFLDVMRVTEEEKISPWDRMWYRLTGLRFQGWKYPSQQNSESIIDDIDLRNCISNEVKPVDTFLCVRPHTFIFKSRESDGKMTTVLCSADTSESMTAWCQRFNFALNATRTWQNPINFH